MNEHSQTMAVIGAGSWGTALAILIANNGTPVRLWGRDPAQIAAMAAKRVNERYLPDIPLPENLTPTAELASAVEGVMDLLLAVPTQAFRATLRVLKPMLEPGTRIAWATKGLEPGSQKFLHQVAEEELGKEFPKAIVSGPNFAREVALGLPSAVTVASDQPETATYFADRLHGQSFRAYTSADVVGVEVGGAAKNVLAIAAGIADGLGFGANTRSALITRGLAEMMRLGIAVGGQQETLMGLAGLGDLVLTCTDNQSRNRRVGIALGQGQSLEEAIKSVGQAVEGVRSAPEICHLAQERGVEMPIIEQVLAVLEGRCSPHEAVDALLGRDRKAEIQ